MTFETFDQSDDMCISETVFLKNLFSKKVFSKSVLSEYVFSDVKHLSDNIWCG